MRIRDRLPAGNSGAPEVRELVVTKVTRRSVSTKK
jgi:hypothetical protein